jgi:hypothetical protein
MKRFEIKGIKVVSNAWDYSQFENSESWNVIGQLSESEFCLCRLTRDGSGEEEIFPIGEIFTDYEEICEYYNV